MHLFKKNEKPAAKPPSLAEEIEEVQRQVGRLRQLIDEKDKEFDELQGSVNFKSSDIKNMQKHCDDIEMRLGMRREAPPNFNIEEEDDEESDQSEFESESESESESEQKEDLDLYMTPLVMIPFDPDTFSLMMTNPPMSRAWILALQAASFQWTILLLIFINVTSDQQTPLNIPYSVPVSVTAGQFMSIFICVGVQTDVSSVIRMTAAMRGEEDWAELLGVEQDNATKMTFFVRVALPNIMKFISGCLVLVVNFITIVQSDNIVDLMKDVSALLIISEITEIVFQLAEFGFLGQKLEDNAKTVGETEVQDPFGGAIGSDKNYFRLIAFSGTVLAMSGAVGYFIFGQQNGSFFYKTYPYCMISQEQIAQFGDDQCDGGILNSIACDFDGGDCVNYNLEYPTCGAAAPWKIGDGICDQAYNTPQCNYDGADCCPFVSVDELGVETRDIR